jgi:hypothetical protein
MVLKLIFLFRTVIHGPEAAIALQDQHDQNVLSKTTFLSKKDKSWGIGQKKIICKEKFSLQYLVIKKGGH